jgi:hypothetical protein
MIFEIIIEKRIVCREYATSKNKQKSREIIMCRFKTKCNIYFNIDPEGPGNAAAKRPWDIGDDGDELAPPVHKKIREEVLTNEMDPNNKNKNRQTHRRTEIAVQRVQY